MKTLITLLSCLLSCSLYSQPIPNASFENWYKNPAGSWPDSLADDWILNSGIVMPNRDSPGLPEEFKPYQGSSAMLLGNTALMLGEIQAVFSVASRPKLFSFYFKYTPYSSLKPKPWQFIDRFEVEVLLFKWEAGQRIPVSYTLARPNEPAYTGEPIKKWTRFEIPLPYVSNVQPDSALILFRATSKDKPTVSTVLSLDALAFEGVYTGSGTSTQSPELIELYPNPLEQGSGSLHFFIHDPQKVSISVYDIQGRELLQYKARHFEAGMQEQKIQPDAALPAGIYLLRVQGERFSKTIKILCR